jgi:hypothetical protein
MARKRGSGEAGRTKTQPRVNRKCSEPHLHASNARGDSTSRFPAFPLLKLRLETEDPPELELIITGSLVLSQLGATDVQWEIDSGHEFGIANAVLGAKADSGITEEPDPAIGGHLAHPTNPVREIGKECETHPPEQMRGRLSVESVLQLEVERDDGRGGKMGVDPANPSAPRRLVIEVVTYQEGAAGAKEWIVQLIEWVGTLKVDLPLFGRVLASYSSAQVRPSAEPEPMAQIAAACRFDKPTKVERV